MSSQTPWLAFSQAHRPCPSTTSTGEHFENRLWAKLLRHVTWGAALMRPNDNMVLMCNRAFARMHRWKQKELVGQSFTTILAPDPEAMLPFHIRLADGRNHYSFESAHIRKDGQQFLASTELITIKNMKDGPVCRVAFVQNINQRKKNQQRQERALENLKNQLHDRTVSLRHLSGEVLRAQDTEHRRIARALHDSIGQYLTALKIDLHNLADQKTNSVEPQQNEHKDYLAECLELVDLSLAETRTLSHLLHPPLLDEAGFISAAHWYIDGFSSRSGIHVQAHLPDSSIRLPDALELALFRTLQESLTNVYRHSGSKTVAIYFAVTADNILLRIRDRGRGIDRSILHEFKERGVGVGVGLSGIRERITELNGSFDIQSGRRGTTLTARWRRPLDKLPAASSIS